MSIYTHNHHIIPKHMGGTDDASNLVELTIEQHAEAHRVLYEKYGRWQDKLAWKGLSGQMSSQELAHQRRDHGLRTNNPMWRPEAKKVHSDRMKKDNPNKGGATNHTARSVRLVYVDGTIEDYKYMKEVSEVKGIPHGTVKYMFKHGKGSQKWGIERVIYTD